jgi:hypothetical protein
VVRCSARRAEADARPGQLKGQGLANFKKSIAQVEDALDALIQYVPAPSKVDTKKTPSSRARQAALKSITRELRLWLKKIDEVLESGRVSRQSLAALPPSTAWQKGAEVLDDVGDSRVQRLLRGLYGDFDELREAYDENEKLNESDEFRDLRRSLRWIWGRRLRGWTLAWWRDFRSRTERAITLVEAAERATPR